MYSIKAVSQATGLSIETLRAWERRYRIVEPQRDPSGRRAYRPDDVIRLRKLREATENGHPISRLASLSERELDTILQAAKKSGGSVPPLQRIGAQMIEAAEDYRPADCDRLLAMALALLPASQVVTDVLAPTMVEVGERWHRGEMSIVQERIISQAVRKQLSSVLDTYGRIADGPVMVLATPSGERHELGILMCALLAASKNVRCHYLGADLPVPEMSHYASRVGADALTVSVLMSEHLNDTLGQLGELASTLPDQIEIWGGGNAITQLAGGRLPRRIKLLDDMNAFEREIALLEARIRH